MKTVLVFLVGAGRSGTTLLYKLLSMHPEAGYISNYNAKFPRQPQVSYLNRLIAPFPMLKRTAWYQDTGNAYFMRRPWSRRILPSPVEGEEIYSLCGLPKILPPDHEVSASTVLCLQHNMEVMASCAGGRVFLSKRTANNQRLPWLMEIFPEAKYIHLNRDGRAVAYSLSRVEWWKDHTVWWAGRSVTELIRDGHDDWSLCARNWVEDVRAVQNGLKGVTADKVLELRYEDLMLQPEQEIGRLLTFLGLGGNAGFRRAWRSLGLRPRRDRWRDAWSDVERERILSVQGPLLRELGYVRP